MLRTVRASHAPLTRRPDPPNLSVLVVRPAAGAQTLLAAFARRRADRALERPWIRWVVVAVTAVVLGAAALSLAGVREGDSVPVEPAAGPSGPRT